MDKFAVFILTHGRPNKVKTYSTLLKQGYTGDIYIVVDNEDETVDEYVRLYGKQVVAFDKSGVDFDVGDNFVERRGVVYARNACFAIARELGLDYFLALDDDYLEFSYNFTKYLKLSRKRVLNLDRLFEIYLEYYKKIDALTIAMSQGGDFIGGKKSDRAEHIKLLRKCMNTFFCSTERRFKFVGRINEDVNTYAILGYRGELMFTVLMSRIEQQTTQKQKGGLTEQYLSDGTYVKSFYTVMYCPSFAKISLMGDRWKRIHHKIAWNNAVPCILSEKYRMIGIQS